MGKGVSSMNDEYYSKPDYTPEPCFDGVIPKPRVLSSGARDDAHVMKPTVG
jgi:hypothetical protein